MAKNKKTNIEVSTKENTVTATINPKIYPLPIILQACDVFIDRAYMFLDGDPEKSVSVIMKPKEKSDLNKLAGELNNEILNYAAYFVRSQVNKDTRDAMLKRAFATADIDKDTGKKFEDMQSKRQKIDIGAKVPLVACEGEKDEAIDFNEDVFKKWEDQKGAIKPKDSKQCRQAK